MGTKMRRVSSVFIDKMNRSRQDNSVEPVLRRNRWTSADGNEKSPFRHQAKMGLNI
jgi:hypothetical protein